MIPNRLDALMNGLLNDTVFADLVAPVQRALAFVRRAASVGRVLSMERFIALGVWRQLQGMGVLREQVQALDHLRDQLAPQAESVVPLARSTWSDALASTERRALLQAMIPVLMREVGAVLPDRLAGVPGLDGRPVRAMDGTYQEESAHYRRCTPKQGGEDNPKGHGELVFYNLRLGLAEDALVETRSRHEINLLRDYDARPGALTQEARTLWVVDRAFIDAAFWDRKKRTQGSTLITRMKSNLVVGSRAAMPIAKTPENAVVLRDERRALLSSSQEWRLITLRTRQGRRLEFLTNDFSLLPGVVAFLYARRWDEEVYFKEAKQSLGLLWEQTETFASHLAPIHLTAVRYCLLAFAQIQGAGTRVCEVRTAVGAQLSELDFAKRLWGFFRALIAEAVDGLQKTFGPAGTLVMSAIDERVQRFFVQALQLDEFTLRLEGVEHGSIEA